MALPNDPATELTLKKVLDAINKAFPASAGVQGRGGATVRTSADRAEEANRQKAKRTMVATTKAVDALGTSANHAAGSLKELQARAKNLTGQFKKLGDETDEASGSVKNLGTKSDTAAGKLGDLSKKAGAATDGLGEFRSGIADTLKALAAAQKTLDKLDFSGATDEFRAALKQLDFSKIPEDIVALLKKLDFTEVPESIQDELKKVLSAYSFDLEFVPKQIEEALRKALEKLKVPESEQEKIDSKNILGVNVAVAGFAKLIEGSVTTRFNRFNKILRGTTNALNGLRRAAQSGAVPVPGISTPVSPVHTSAPTTSVAPVQATAPQPVDTTPDTTPATPKNKDKKPKQPKKEEKPKTFAEGLNKAVDKRLAHLDDAAKAEAIKKIGRLGAVAGAVSLAFGGILRASARILDEMKGLAAAGYGLTDSYTSLSWYAAQNGMALSEYTDMMKESMAVVSRSSSFADFQAKLKVGTDALAKFGQFGPGAAKAVGEIMTTSTQAGISQDRMNEAVLAQTKAFGELQKTTGMTVEEFSKLTAEIMSDTQVRTDMLSLSQTERIRLQAQLTQQGLYARSLNLSTAEVNKYTQAILEQRKSTVKSRFKQAGVLQQMAGMAGMAPEQIDELRKLTMKKNKDPAEQKRYDELLGELGARQSEMQRNSEDNEAYGGSNQVDIAREKMAEAGLSTAMEAAAAIRLAKESGSVTKADGSSVNADMGKQLSEGQQTLLKATTVLEGAMKNTLTQIATSAIAGIAAAAASYFAAAPIIGTIIGKIIGRHYGGTPPAGPSAGSGAAGQPKPNTPTGGPKPQAPLPGAQTPGAGGSIQHQPTGQYGQKTTTPVNATPAGTKPGSVIPTSQQPIQTTGTGAYSQKFTPLQTTPIQATPANTTVATQAAPVPATPAVKPEAPKGKFGKYLGSLGQISKLGMITGAVTAGASLVGAVQDGNAAAEQAKATGGDVGAAKGSAIGQGLGGAVGAVGGVVAGSAAGAWVGGVLGSIAGPLGTIAGATIGRELGGLVGPMVVAPLGEWAGKIVGAWMGSDKTAKKNTEQTKANTAQVKANAEELKKTRDQMIAERRASAGSSVIDESNLASVQGNILRTGRAYVAPTDAEVQARWSADQKAKATATKTVEEVKNTGANITPVANAAATAAGAAAIAPYVRNPMSSGSRTATPVAQQLQSVVSPAPANAASIAVPAAVAQKTVNPPAVNTPAPAAPAKESAPSNALQPGQAGSAATPNADVMKQMLDVLKQMLATENQQLELSNMMLRARNSSMYVPGKDVMVSRVLAQN